MQNKIEPVLIESDVLWLVLQADRGDDDTRKELVRDTEQAVLARVRADGHHILAAFLERSSQWLTNEATHTEFARQVREQALADAAAICDSVDNYANPMTSHDCTDAIRALKDAPAAKPQGGHQVPGFAEWLQRSYGGTQSFTAWNMEIAYAAGLEAKGTPAAAIGPAGQALTFDRWWHAGGSRLVNQAADKRGWQGAAEAGYIGGLLSAGATQLSGNPGPLAVVERDGYNDGGRNMFHEGKFDGESDREQKARLAWANDMRAAFERHTGNG